MAAQNGSQFVIKATGIGSPTADYDTIGGFKTKSLSINNQMVDVTDQDSGDWREILADAGIQSIEVSGSGIFKDSVMENGVRSAAMANTHLTAQIVIPGLGTFSGTFAIPTLRYAGTVGEAVTFDITLQSNGQVTFA